MNGTSSNATIPFEGKYLSAGTTVGYFISLMASVGLFLAINAIIFLNKRYTRKKDQEGPKLYENLTETKSEKRYRAITRAIRKFMLLTALVKHPPICYHLNRFLIAFSKGYVEYNFECHFPHNFPCQHKPFVRSIFSLHYRHSLFFRFLGTLALQINDSTQKVTV